MVPVQTKFATACKGVVSGCQSIATRFLMRSCSSNGRALHQLGCMHKSKYKIYCLKKIIHRTKLSTKVKKK